MNERAAPLRRFVIWYAVAWLPVAAVAVTGGIMSSRGSTAPAIARALTSIVVTALLGAPLWPLTLRLETRARRQAIATYALVGLCWSVAFAVAGRLVEALPWSSGGMAPQQANAVGLIRGIVGGFFTYVVIVAVMRAVRNVERVNAARQAVADANQARVAAEALRGRAELQALRAHLDPHFLFNTLNAIAAVVETDPAQARDMLVRAAALLRRILDLGATGRDTVSVAEEWTMASEYLAFEQVRMGDRLHVVAQFSEDALECEIPAFMLQPLVENAIRHGLFPRPAGGTLTVTGNVERGWLHLEVADDGVGASPDRVNRDGGGFGLRATRQRLRGMYRDSEARLDVETAPDRGFRARIVIPINA